MAMTPNERRDKIQELENEMMKWVEGRKSHWNYYQSATIGADGERSAADASVLCSQADAAEVAKLSAAIIALRSGL